MKEYKLIYYKKSVSVLFGKGDKTIEEFDDIDDAYRRYIELTNNKKKYVVNIYKSNVKITSVEFLYEWSTNIKQPYILSKALDNNNESSDEYSNKKTFKHKLKTEGENPEKRLISIYYDDLLFSIYITNDYRLGVYSVNIEKLLYLLDANYEFNVSFKILTEIIESEGIEMLKLHDINLNTNKKVSMSKDETTLTSEQILSNSILHIFEPIKGINVVQY